MVRDVRHTLGSTCFLVNKLAEICFLINKIAARWITICLAGPSAGLRYR